MGIDSKDAKQPSNTSAQRIIASLIVEESRFSNLREPRQLESLASDLGVKQILKRPLTNSLGEHPGVDAMLVPLGDGYTVVINESAPLARQRYSLAHELGHIMLLATESHAREPARTTRFRSASPESDKKRSEERLCDEIAAELLMPEASFSKEVEWCGRSLEHLPRLANLFGTSLTATAIRFWELLPEPCHLVKWKKTIHRTAVVSPAWQMRNRLPGPYLRPLVKLSDPSTFRAMQECWGSVRLSRSIESLLVEYQNAGRRYITAGKFETESIGYGSPKNRAVMSVIYLSRTFENN